ncbi:MAG: flagellar basal body rod protein FlgC [Armatimonadetes bacterium]|nr:flagellar basal body rod protein FlgC [Armatimonadota bacterium]
MAIASSMRISASALTAQRCRLDVIAGNLANAQTTRTSEGGPYRRREVVFQVADTGQGGGVRVARVQESAQPPVQIYNPHHPDADPNGYVTVPNINPITEMVDMMAATRAYEANVTAFNAAKQMINAALELGRG